MKNEIMSRLADEMAQGRAHSEWGVGHRAWAVSRRPSSGG